MLKYEVLGAGTHNLHLPEMFRFGLHDALAKMAASQKRRRLELETVALKDHLGLGHLTPTSSSAPRAPYKLTRRQGRAPGAARRPVSYRETFFVWREVMALATQSTDWRGCLYRQYHHHWGRTRPPTVWESSSPSSPSRQRGVEAAGSRGKSEICLTCKCPGRRQYHCLSLCLQRVREGCQELLRNLQHQGEHQEFR